MPEARPATTLLLVRSAPSSACGAEIFMVQRHRNSGFLPNAWVFPGGRVDEGDRLADHPAITGGEAVALRWGVTREQAVPHLVAGVRETFEECGIWLGTRAPPPEERNRLASRETSLGAVLDRYGSTVDLDRLLPWSHWVTPEVEKKRFDTHFLLVVVDGEAVGTHDERETVASGWFDPAAVVAEGTLGTFPLAPPTWWTLRELASHAGIREIVAATEGRVLRPIQPVMEFRADGMILLLPGHPEHPEAAIAGLPTHVVYDGDRWVAHDGSYRLPALPRD